MTEELRDRTIRNFGDQWTRYTDNEGYYGSVDLLADMFGPLVGLDEVKGRKVGDIGSGTGRIVLMLLKAGAAHVTAVEPSDAYDVLMENTREHRDKVTGLRCRGEEIPAGLDLDLVTSMGVLHHIPEPAAVVRATLQAVRPGGRFVVWLYGREGNGAYLNLVLPLRSVTTHLPHAVVAGLSHALNVALGGYIALCRVLPLPLHRYMKEVIGPFSWRKRVLVIFDQLQPAFAKYYTRDEAYRLLADQGFTDVRLHHRHGYSWTVVGTRPGS